MQYKENIVYDIPLKNILYNEDFNCRGKIDAPTVWDLAESIKENGQQQAVIVRVLDPPFDGKSLQLIAGFRRFKACKILELETIRAEVKFNIDDREAKIINLAENLNRRDLSVMDEARAVLQLHSLGLNREEIGKRFGKGHGWAQVRIMLTKFPKRVQEIADEGVLTIQNIRDLNSFNDDEEMVAAAETVRMKKARGLQGVKVSHPKKHGRKRVTSLKRVRKPPEIVNLLEYFNEHNVPFGFHTRCLAWATGEISDRELVMDIMEYMKDLGLNYIPPENYDIPIVRKEENKSIMSVS